MSADPQNIGEPIPLPRGRHNLERDVVLASQRGRLLTAFAELAADQGYDAVTIIEIVSRAGTSKRTFYEHFTDKQDCLIQTFETARSILVSAVVAEAGPVDDPIERIAVGVRAYVEALLDNPHFTRLLLNESMSTGPELAGRWIDATEQFADVLVRWRNESRVEHPEVPKLSRLQAVTVLAGINEIIRSTVFRSGVEAVSALTDDLVKLAIRLLTADD